MEHSNSPLNKGIQLHFVPQKMFWAETNVLKTSRTAPQFGEIARSYEPGWNIYGVVRSYEGGQMGGVLPLKFYVWSGEFSKQKFQTGILELNHKEIPKESGQATFGVIVTYPDNMFQGVYSDIKPGQETEEELLKECFVHATQNPEFNKAKTKQVSEKKIKKFEKVGTHFSFIGAELKPEYEKKGYINCRILDDEVMQILPKDVQENSVYPNPEEEFVRKNTERAFRFLEIYQDLRIKMQREANEQKRDRLTPFPKPEVEFPIVVEAYCINPSKKLSYATYDMVQKTTYFDEENNPKPSCKGVSLISTIPLQKMTDLGEGGEILPQMYALLNQVKNRFETSRYSINYDSSKKLVNPVVQDVMLFNKIFTTRGY